MQFSVFVGQSENYTVNIKILPCFQYQVFCSCNLLLSEFEAYNIHVWFGIGEETGCADWCRVQVSRFFFLSHSSKLPSCMIRLPSFISAFIVFSSLVQGCRWAPRFGSAIKSAIKSNWFKFNSMVDLRNLQVAPCLQAKAHQPSSPTCKPLRTFWLLSKHFLRWIQEMDPTASWFCNFKACGMLLLGK